MEGETSSERDLLERMLLSPSMEPKRLSLSVLKDITNNFSDAQLIGSGGFATVYKGLLQNGKVAVKKMSNNFGFDETAFLREIGCLLMAKHPNIVRFLGYCGDTQHELMTLEGKHILAEDRQRLLCFEFLSGGSLDSHITDASGGLQWRPRYHIIKGICEGLNYLHVNNIVHSDLKPQNILLDDHMNPKIADFGLSMCFAKGQTQFTSDGPTAGTLGYMAPEFHLGTITRKTDIFSLGVLIIEILTGKKGGLEYIEKVDIENVLKNWSTRFEKSQGGTEWLDHVRLCAEIGKECLKENPKERPDAWRIIERLNSMEHTSGVTTETDNCTSAAQARSPLKKPCDDAASKPLDVQPSSLRFLFEPNKRTECPVTLTNRTDHHAGVWVTPVDHHGFPLLWDQKPLQVPIFHMIEPRTSLAVRVAMEKKHRKVPRGESTFEVVMAVMGSKDRLEMLKSFVDSMPHVNSYILRIMEVVMVAMDSTQYLEKLKSYFSWRNWKTLLKAIEGSMVSTVGSKGTDSLRLYMCRVLNIQSDDVLNRMEQLGARVQRQMLEAAAYDQPSASVSNGHKFISTSQFRNASGMDVHPTKPWFLVGHDEGHVSVWNYETQEIEMVFKVSKADGTCCPVKSAKFIAREQWLAAGDANGWIFVYDYTTKEKVVEFEAHGGHPVSSLDVQSTGSFMLTSSSVALTSTKLWYWGQGWRCAREFDQNSGGVSHLTFNPRDDTKFASISMDGDVKVWDSRISHPITTLQEKSTGACSFYTDNSDRHFLLTSVISRADSSCASAMIRDYQTQQVVHQLSIMGQWVFEVACHPTLPIVATVTKDRLIYFWNTRTYRAIEKIVELKEHPIRGMVFTLTDLPRLIVPCSKGVSIVELSPFAAHDGPTDNCGSN